LQVLARCLQKEGQSFIVCLFVMGGRNGKEEDFTQPILAGMEGLQPEETELDNCLVLSRPVYRDTGKKQEWTCVLHAQPSIFQPDTDMEVTVSAGNELATQSQRKSLKPGDRVILTGVMRVDTVTFPTGETKTIYSLTLTHAPQMVAREKRVSTTVYEQRKTR
jgi:hypothetical protein